jgi:hypothetical protein
MGDDKSSQTWLASYIFGKNLTTEKYDLQSKNVMKAQAHL